MLVVWGMCPEEMILIKAWNYSVSGGHVWGGEEGREGGVCACVCLFLTSSLSMLSMLSVLISFIINAINDLLSVSLSVPWSLSVSSVPLSVSWSVPLDHLPISLSVLSRLLSVSLSTHYLCHQPIINFISPHGRSLSAIPLSIWYGWSNLLVYSYRRRQTHLQSWHNFALYLEPER